MSRFIIVAVVDGIFFPACLLFLLLKVVRYEVVVGVIDHKGNNRIDIGTPRPHFLHQYDDCMYPPTGKTESNSFVRRCH
jgi:hypothetical protein